MNETTALSTLEQTVPILRDIAEKESLLEAEVQVLAGPLTPEEAIGNPARKDFPILIGRERVVEARVLGSRGHAFTDSPREFTGLIEDVLAFDLVTNPERAIYVATLNAVLGHLGRVTANVHCKDDDPETCADEIAVHLFDRYGLARIGLIGLNPAIAERLADRFESSRVRITDRNPDQVGGRRFGVEIWDGTTHGEDLVNISDVILVTGTTVVNGTFDAIRRQVEEHGKPMLVYGVTAAGVCHLMDFERICPCGRTG